MIDLKDRYYCPTLEEIGTYVNNPVFRKFCSEIQADYKCSVKIEYSSCSWEPGWNIKFKKSGKSLCTIYPRETYFTALVVAGKKEKEAVESLLADSTVTLRKLYEQTQEGNGQRWLMIDLEDQDALYQDTLNLIKIRSKR